jgi:hypothetical protein
VLAELLLEGPRRGGVGQGYHLASPIFQQAGFRFGDDSDTRDPRVLRTLVLSQSANRTCGGSRGEGRIGLMMTW